MPDVDQAKHKELPFAAPCRRISRWAALRWLSLGWQDLRQAPVISITCGVLMTAPILLTTWLTWNYGGAWLVFAMLIGFVFMAPLGCIATYAISAQLERGMPVSLTATLGAPQRYHFATLLVFALVLLIIFLVWLRAASAVSIFIPASEGQGLTEMAIYMSALALVSLIFLALTFMVSVFSLPMILHRNVDAITAVVTSVNATLRNKLAMAVWAMLILAALSVGTITSGIGLVLILPIIGHAAWHGYLETIDASEFPRHELGVTSKARS